LLSAINSLLSNVSHLFLLNVTYYYNYSVNNNGKLIENINKLIKCQVIRFIFLNLNIIIVILFNLTFKTYFVFAILNLINRKLINSEDFLNDYH
jgi:hypothetical protein